MVIVLLGTIIFSELRALNLSVDYVILYRVEINFSCIKLRVLGLWSSKWDFSFFPGRMKLVEFFLTEAVRLVRSAILASLGILFTVGFAHSRLVD